MRNINKMFFLIIILFFFTSNSKSQTNGYLAYADKMPELIGGMATIYKQIEYPDIARRAGVEGKVYVLAFINEEGSVDDVKLVKGIGAGCDEATITAVMQSKFVPGEVEGKPAKIKVALQVQFKLN